MKNVSIILFVISFSVVNLKTVLAITLCEMKLKDKCLGDMGYGKLFGIPNDDAKLIGRYYRSNYVLCADQCDRNQKCFMAFINTNSGECSLYENISYTQTAVKAFQLYRWYCCNPNISYPAPNRCPGFWKYVQNNQSNNIHRSMDPLVELRVNSRKECSDACLSNNICGAINILSNYAANKRVMNCQLIIQYPVEDLQLQINASWNTLQWQCAGNYTHPAPPGTCIPREHYSMGHWIIYNTSMVFSNVSKQLLFFHTLDYNDCLDNCAKYKDCKAAWFSQSSLFCILEAYERSTCAEKNPIYYDDFIQYKWRNCDQMTLERENTEIEKSTCRTLVNNRYVYIYPMECGVMSPSMSYPYPCWTNLGKERGTKFSYAFHCQSNQSFSVIETKRCPIPTLCNFTNTMWIKVSTNYDVFWLVNVTSDEFLLTNNYNCEIFDASMDIRKYSSLKIIRRKQWFPSKPYRNPRKFPKHPVKYVIITDSERPFCNCFSVTTCSYVLREMQIFMWPSFGSVHFSFVIGGDGTAYEARGWDFEPTLTPTIRFPNSINFALCGRYKHSPNLRSLIAIKQLIKMSISLQKLSKNYTMYIYNDIVDKPYPYEGMRRVFELWPHYRGYVREDCGSLSYATISLNIVAIIFVIFTLMFYLHTFVMKIFHNKHCYTILHSRITQIYGHFSTKVDPILPHVPTHNLKDLSNESIYLSPLTTIVYWIDDYPQWFPLNEYENSCNCRTEVFSYFDFCHLKSNLVNLGHLIILPELSSCKKRICIFFNNLENSNDYLFIHHYSEDRTFQRFASCLQQAKCVCNTFKLSKYSASPQYFGRWNRTYKVIKTTPRMGKNSRVTIQDKYTFLLSKNFIIKYYS